MAKRQTTCYRGKIESIIAGHAKPGEDLSASIMTGSPNVIDRNEAIGIANWLRDEADGEWGYDPRNRAIASEIVQIVEGD